MGELWARVVDEGSRRLLGESLKQPIRRPLLLSVAWCGMVWRGVVGVVWRGWCGVVSVAWCGVAWCGVV